MCISVRSMTMIHWRTSLAPQNQVASLEGGMRQSSEGGTSLGSRSTSFYQCIICTPGVSHCIPTCKSSTSACNWSRRWEKHLGDWLWGRGCLLLFCLQTTLLLILPALQGQACLWNWGAGERLEACVTYGEESTDHLHLAILSSRHPPEWFYSVRKGLLGFRHVHWQGPWVVFSKPSNWSGCQKLRFRKVGTWNIKLQIKWCKQSNILLFWKRDGRICGEFKTNTTSIK